MNEVNIFVTKGRSNDTLQNNGLAVKITAFLNSIFRSTIKSLRPFDMNIVETLFVQGRNIVPSKLVIGEQGLFNFRQPILLGTRFLPWTNKVSMCRKAL